MNPLILHICSLVAKHLYTSVLCVQYKLLSWELDLLNAQTNYIGYYALYSIRVYTEPEQERHISRFVVERRRLRRHATGQLYRLAINPCIDVGTCSQTYISSIHK